MGQLKEKANNIRSQFEELARKTKIPGLNYDRTKFPSHDER